MTIYCKKIIFNKSQYLKVISIIEHHRGKIIFSKQTSTGFIHCIIKRFVSQFYRQLGWNREPFQHTQQHEHMCHHFNVTWLNRQKIEQLKVLQGKKETSLPQHWCQSINNIPKQELDKQPVLQYSVTLPTHSVFMKHAPQAVSVHKKYYISNQSVF